MTQKSSLPSAVIVKWPAAFKVSLEIDPERVANEETVGTVGLRLVKLGGTLISWQPDLNGRPALAEFEFLTARARARFLGEARRIAGVSIAQPDRTRPAGSG